MTAAKQPIREKSTLFVADSRANHSAFQDEEKERKTTVTSGRKCIALYRNHGPAGLLAKTLLTSRAWHSPAQKLTWKAQATPCNHLLFRLAPSGCRIDGIGSGLLPTVLRADGTMTNLRSRLRRHETWETASSPTARILRGSKEDQLNPEYIEEVMGFPKGWTALPH